jgi:glyoxylase-like metal-dependent hydrolase (beta-lactamase superfamily II)
MLPVEHKVGRSTVVKVHELDLPDFTVTQLLPGLSEATLDAHPAWHDSRVYDPQTGRVNLSVHTWVVRHEGNILLIDTGAGNDKDRPTLRVLDHLRQPFLARLAAVGVLPEQVNYILLTHIHADHVGWNTRLADSEWVATFPNATLICSAIEWQYSAALATSEATAIRAVQQQAGLGEPVRLPVPGVFADSLAPLAPANRLQLIPIDGTEVLPGVRFMPTPGHSIDHAAILLTSDGDEALFGGDVLHHPFELYDPALVSMFCEFPATARASRQWLANYAADRDLLYFSSHFPASSAGYIRRSGSAFSWQFTE